MQSPGQTIAWVGLLIGVVLIYSVSLKWGGRPNTIKEFFHQRNPLLNSISLIAASLGLGTGLIAALTFVRAYGFLCLLFPVMMFFGQRFYSWLATQLNPQVWCKRGTILSGISDELDVRAKGAVHFQRVAIAFIILTHITALAFEVYASSDWLAITLVPDAGTIGKGLIMSLIVFVVMTYIMTGGFRTTQTTDCLQCFTALPFVIIVCGLLFYFAPAQSPIVKTPTRWWPLPTGWIGIMSFGTILLGPLTTQVYGVLNNTFASHQETNTEQRWIFMWARRFTFILYMVIVAAAMYCLFYGGVPVEVVKEWLVSRSQSASVIVAFATLAMVSMVMSSVDTLVMAITQAGFEGLLDGDSKKEDGGEGLARIRKWMLAIYPITFIMLLLALINNVAPLKLLYAMASPCEVLAPMIVCFALLARDSKLDVLLRPRVGKRNFLDVYYFLLTVTAIIAVVTTFLNLSWAGTIGISAFFASTVLSCLIWIRKDKDIICVENIAAGLNAPKIKGT